MSYELEACQYELEVEREEKAELKERIELLESMVKAFQHEGQILRAENEELANALKDATHQVDIKRKIINGLKLNNSALTVERNELIQEISDIKHMSMFEFAQKYCSDEENAKAGRAFAEDLLGGA